jgi:hypothetical protein
VLRVHEFPAKKSISKFIWLSLAIFCSFQN